MKLRQSGEVTFRGRHREKHQRAVFAHTFEAFFICVFLLCLFLTGCSGSFNGGGDSTAPKQILQASGEANLPPKPDVLSSAPADASSNPATAADGAPIAANGTETVLKNLVSQEEVITRVRTVTGWLKFVRQENTVRGIAAGWEAVLGGKVSPPLDETAPAGLPEVSKTQLMLWRQILRLSSLKIVTKDGKPAASRDCEPRVEALAVMLTTSNVPEDLFRADELLIVAEPLAAY